VSFAAVLLAAAAFLALAMAGAWAVQRATGNSGWIDAVWSYATAAAGVFLALVPLDGPPGWRQWVVAGVVAAWGLRLGTHIARRSAASHDDPRYAALRRDWGDGFSRRLFWFLQIQAACGFVLAVSAMAAARYPADGVRAADVVALGILVAALVGEAVADAQLRRFRADPANRGKVCTDGLWGWSRHPNYFFEWLFWCAWPVMALGTGFGLVAFAGPVLMYWLLVHASGIPPLEAVMLASRGDAYRAYQARVSPFFPLPPKRAP